MKSKTPLRFVKHKYFFTIKFAFSLFSKGYDFLRKGFLHKYSHLNYSGSCCSATLPANRSYSRSARSSSEKIRWVLKWNSIYRCDLVTTSLRPIVILCWIGPFSSLRAEESEKRERKMEKEEISRSWTTLRNCVRHHGGKFLLANEGRQ